MDNLPDPITIQQLPEASDNETIDESEPDAEDEIDQLDSDSDAQVDPQVQPDVPVVKRPSMAKAGERRPGQTLLPNVRIENILQADGVLGNLNLSKEGTFLLAVATEEFIRNLVKAGHDRATEHTRTMVRYHDMANVVRSRYEFNFLQDTIPLPRSLASALASRARREHALLQDDPAMQFQDGRARPQDSFVPQVLPTEPQNTIGHTNGGLQNGPDCPPLGSLPPDSVGPSWRALDSENHSYKKNSRRSSSKKNGTPVPSNPYPNPNPNTGAISAPTQTWEEWKAKSKLYRTGDDLRRKPSQAFPIASGIASSSQHALHPSSGEAQPLGEAPWSQPLPSIHQWDIPELLNQVDHSEVLPNGQGNRKARPNHKAIESTKNIPPSNPPSGQFEHPHEKPAAIISHQGQDPSWTQSQPLAGPGVTFLQGPGGPFPRPSPSASAPAPPSLPASGPGHITAETGSPGATITGRTIYSLNNPAD